ncbi:hypothetical protein PS2_028857 [Malus domestica]
MVTRAKDGIRRPNPKYALLAITVDDLVEPTCFSQANKYPEWRQAMADEFNALQRTGTWTLVPCQPHFNVLPNKWVYRIKRKSDGSIERFKARLVANGFHQQEGLDYGETFSPVVTHATIRLILSVALHFHWPIRQLDVQNAFLHGTLAEDVFMRQPSGFVDPQYPTHVCKLRRSLYGLKQAPRAWFQCFSHHLEDLGFLASTADSSLFTYFNGATIIYLLIYVDDILVTGNDAAHISRLIAQLGLLFSMKDLGPLKFFLGMEVTRTPTGMYLSQSKYIVDLLRRTKMTDCKPTSTPATAGRRLSLHEGEPLSDATEFRSVVGALQYLLFTRPDIAFAVNQVCQYMHSPTTTHWAAVKRILRYLKATHDHALVYTASSLTLTAYADADYAGIQMIDDPLEVTVFSLVVISFRGVPRNKEESLAPAQRPNTVSLLTPPPLSLGSETFFVIFIFIFFLHVSGVIISVLSLLPLIQSIKLGCDMSRLITIMCRKKSLEKKLLSVMLPPLIN